MKLSRMARISFVLGVVLIIIGLIVLRWPRSLDWHLDRAEQITYISIMWSSTAGSSKQIELKEGDEDFARVLSMLRAVKVQHVGMIGNFTQIEAPPLFTVYLATKEGAKLRELGELDCDKQGNLYMGSSQYKIIDGADWLAHLDSLEGK